MPIPETTPISYCVSADRWKLNRSSVGRATIRQSGVPREAGWRHQKPLTSRAAPRSRWFRMNTKQAKDFLVQQVTEQAVLDNVSLSEIELKMMYFTESDPTSCPNPSAINDEFEVQYDTPEYEAKISRLLQHAYGRLKAEDPEESASGTNPFANFVREITMSSFCWTSNLPASIRRTIPSNFWEPACS